MVQILPPPPGPAGTQWMRMDPPGTPIWQHEHHADADDAPILSVFAAGGVVFSAGRDRKVIAADARSGEKIWEHQRHTGRVNAVFARQGQIYSGADDRHVIAADIADGSQIWRHSHHADPIGAVTASDSGVYSGAQDGVIAASGLDGAKLWEHTHHDEAFNEIEAIIEAQGVVFSASDAGQVVAADAEDGRLLWRHEHHAGDWIQDLSVDRGVLYSVSLDGLIVAADAGSGALIWARKANPEDARVTSVFARNGLVMWNTFRPVESRDPRLFIADGTTGSILWDEPMDQFSLSIHESLGVVYVAAAETNVVQAISAAPALHVSDGNQWWLLNWLAPAGGAAGAN
ncbi:PQQ-binding-like beta-propeller repeat protein [Wenzhouxiangella limi]|nr:PQQ-binding-like beta-propeller repeat protein [Wenzhouxiangella limi]